MSKKPSLVVYRVREIVVVLASLVELHQLILGHFASARWTTLAFMVLFAFSGWNVIGVVLSPLYGLGCLLIWIVEGRFYVQPYMLVDKNAPASPELESAWADALAVASHSQDPDPALKEA